MYPKPCLRRPHGTAVSRRRRRSPPIRARRLRRDAVPAAAALLALAALACDGDTGGSTARSDGVDAAPALPADNAHLPLKLEGFHFTELGMLVGPPSGHDGPVVPVLGVTADDLENTFGAPRPDERRHLGIDIAAPRGTPVMAAVDGWIVALPSGGAGGRGLHLMDRTGLYLLYYAHLDSYADDVWPGRAVRQRELLGYVGTTGNAQQPHLHLEVGRVRGPGPLDVEPVNPFHYLTAAARPVRQPSEQQ
jgi:peptidoglycan LD-endopeptidase LytH